MSRLIPDFNRIQTRSSLATAVSLITLLLFSGSSWGGAFVTAGEATGVDVISHPGKYLGTGTTLMLNVCQATTGVTGEPALTDWEQALKNSIAIYNQLQPTTGNLWDLAVLDGSMDFESVALHELGHCIGKAHVNLATESGLAGSSREYTKSTNGANNSFDLGIGADGIRGTADDVRGDDVNLHWFLKSNNNPFTLDYDTIDSSTYSRSPTDLPAGDLFAANGERDVATAMGTPSTEAVMQQGSSSGEAQRTLTPDGVATVKYGMTGLDELQGGGDDYDIQLQYANSSCDITASIDESVGLAYCSYSYFSSIGGNAGHHRLVDAANGGVVMKFGVEYDWHFNGATPCQESLSLTQNQWHMFSLPCLVGISTGATVADVFDDDLGTIDSDWSIFEWDPLAEDYTRLGLTDLVSHGKAYWIRTTEIGPSAIDVAGQLPGSPDQELEGSASGTWNMIANPFPFEVDWADVQIVKGSSVVSVGSMNISTEMQKTFHVWNGSTYDARDDSTPGMEGDLQNFGAAWVKVFGTGDGYRLRVPAKPTAIALNAPTGGSASDGEGTRVRVTWSDSAGDEQSYQIWRWDYDGSGCSGPTLKAKVAGDVNLYDDTDFTMPYTGSGFCYHVEACRNEPSKLANPKVNGCSGLGFLTVGDPTVSEVVEESVQLMAATVDEPSVKRIKTTKPKRWKGEKTRQDGAWFVRVVAEAEGKEDRGAVFGQLPGSSDNQDARDLEKRKPFGDKFLSVMFPHEEWGGEEWGFASDYREFSRGTGGEWVFAVYASEDVDEVTLRFEGPDELLKKTKLSQGQNGRKWISKGTESYTFSPKPGMNYFTVRVPGSK